MSPEVAALVDLDAVLELYAGEVCGHCLAMVAERVELEVAGYAGDPGHVLAALFVAAWDWQAADPDAASPAVIHEVAERIARGMLVT